MASGWNVWVWLECIVVVVSGCCYKDRGIIYIYRFPHISYPYSTCISSFFAVSSISLYIYFFVHFKMFFCLLLLSVESNDE